jgi:hypothetical protein
MSDGCSARATSVVSGGLRLALDADPEALQLWHFVFFNRASERFLAVPARDREGARPSASEFCGWAARQMPRSKVRQGSSWAPSC